MFSTTSDIVYSFADLSGSVNSNVYFEPQKQIGKIRVGRCIYSGSKRIDPSFDNFESIIVLMQSHSQ